MNIKPTSEQCQVWSSQAESFAIDIRSQGRHGGKGFAELFNTKFAELAAQWGASQAQQPTDAGRVLEWMRTPDRKPANLAFTDGPERQAAYWIEIAQQTTEPELPEPVIAREEYAVGTGEFYTAAQMHEHYAAGVRAGAVGSQNAKLHNGFVLVPLVMSRAMEEVVQQEDWEWADLLAAAEAVTEEQYNAAMKEQQ